MAWWEYAYVGQRVECISEAVDIRGVELLSSCEIPVIGGHYTIRAITVSEIRVEVCLKLVEIPDQTVSFLLYSDLYTGDVIFGANNFRPLQESSHPAFRGIRALLDTNVEEPA